MQDKNLVLVSYKNKILLSSAESFINDNVWSLIGDENFKSKTQSSTIKLLKNVTSLESLPVTKELLSDNDFLYHIKLNDKNVNSIVRNQGCRLEFYSLKEVEKLNLTNATEILITNFKSKILQLIED